MQDMEHYRNCDERAGYDVSNSELSMRLYDNELEDNIEYDMEMLRVKFNL